MIGHERCAQDNTEPRNAPSSQPLMTRPTPISTTNGAPLCKCGRQWLVRCGATTMNVPISTRVELGSVEQLAIVVDDDGLWMVVSWMWQDAAAMKVYAPPFLGKLTPSPGAMVSTVTPCVERVRQRRRRWHVSAPFDLQVIDGGRDARVAGQERRLYRGKAGRSGPGIFRALHYALGKVNTS